MTRGTSLVIQWLRCKGPVLQMQGAQVQSLVGKLRSYMLCSTIQKKKKTRRAGLWQQLRGETCTLRGPQKTTHEVPQVSSSLEFHYPEPEYGPGWGGWSMNHLRSRVKLKVYLTRECGFAGKRIL